MCGDRCRDVWFDPDNCGDCGEQCGNDEMCLDGACECRPGLDLCGDGCPNLASDPQNCGDCDVSCDPGEKCEAGVCSPEGDGCAQGLRACEGQNDTIACVDTDVDPMNCGDCGERCDRDEMCADGDCVEYARLSECNTCPCDACDQRLDNGVCCDVFGVALCVEDGDCPALP
jgi:hypothetical protein